MHINTPMLSKIFNASTEFMFWLSSSYLSAFDCADLAESGRYGVFFRRQLQDNYSGYRIFKAISRHKSFGCKRRYGKYRLFYTVQACKFVTARFCFWANWTRVVTRIPSKYRLQSAVQGLLLSLQKQLLLLWTFVVTVLILSCLFLCSRGAPNMANH